MCTVPQVFLCCTIVLSITAVCSAKLTRLVKQRADRKSAQEAVELVCYSSAFRHAPRPPFRHARLPSGTSKHCDGVVSLRVPSRCA